eukprot:4838380-Pyramimonas_sp.AAC.1
MLGSPLTLREASNCLPRSHSKLLRLGSPRHSRPTTAAVILRAFGRRLAVTRDPWIRRVGARSTARAE